MACCEVRWSVTPGSTTACRAISLASTTACLAANQGSTTYCRRPPPGVFPPPTISNPIVPLFRLGTSILPGTIWPSPGLPPHPSHGLPGGGGHPDQGLPGSGAHPDQGLPGDQPHPDQGLPAQPGQPSHPIASNTYCRCVSCYSPSLGWKYVVVDPSLTIDNALPPHAQPK